MIIIDPRYNGPSGAANGGIAGGLLATLVEQPATVRFHAPIPLSAPLAASTADDRGRVAVTAGDVLVATVRPTSGEAPCIELPVPSTDEVAAAEAAWSAYVRDRHPYPTCFGCGPRRPPGDGLGLRPGAVQRLDVHATAWRPAGDDDVVPWMLWAALDCASAGPPLAGIDDDEAVVTGELAVAIHRPVAAGRELVAVSRAVGRDGPKTHVVAQLVDRMSGARVASATSTWFTIPKELAP